MSRKLNRKERRKRKISNSSNYIASRPDLSCIDPHTRSPLVNFLSARVIRFILKLPTTANSKWGIPENAFEFFCGDTKKTDFEKKHPSLSRMLFYVGVVLELLPIIINGAVYDYILDNVGAPFINFIFLFPLLIGSGLIGYGFYNIAVAFTNEYLGRFVTLAAITIGLIIVSLSLLACYACSLYIK